MGPIEYEQVKPEDADVAEWLDFYRRQQHDLAATVSQDKARDMLRRSYCVVTARQDGQLIGIARGITDGVRGYLTECKLDPRFQGPAAVTRMDGRIEHDEQGIARELAMRVLKCLRQAGVERIDVTAHGTEEDFCRELGFQPLRGAVSMQMDPRFLEANTLASA